MSKPIKGDSVSAEEKPQPMGIKEAGERLKKLEGWQLSSDGRKILRQIHFKNFREAVDFVFGLASFAEKISHCPDVITIHHSKVIIELTTRQIGGLSEKDFILASEIDEIAGWKKKLEQWLVSPGVLAALIIILLLLFLWRYFR